MSVTQIHGSGTGGQHVLGERCPKFPTRSCGASTLGSRAQLALAVAVGAAAGSARTRSCMRRAKRAWRARLCGLVAVGAGSTASRRARRSSGDAPRVGPVLCGRRSSSPRLSQVRIRSACGTTRRCETALRRSWTARRRAGRACAAPDGVPVLPRRRPPAASFAECERDSSARSDAATRSWGQAARRAVARAESFAQRDLAETTR